MSNYTCSDCGALIEDGRETLHEWHHERINALMESVEAILKVMSEKKKP